MRQTFRETGFAHVLLIIFLLASIPIGLYLVQRTQIFKPKAYSKPDVDPILYDQRIAELKTKFKIPEDVPKEEVQDRVKEDLLKADIIVEGDIIGETAQVAVVGGCLNEQQTNYIFSEYGAFPPICLTDAEREKILEYVTMGAESLADFAIPYTQGKKALELEPEAIKVNELLRASGIADRVSTTKLSRPDSGFGGYGVTLMRLWELEQDVKHNPDGSGKLILAQEEARREYLVALRGLWEKQHNLSIELANITVFSLIGEPLKMVGKVAEPISRPLIVSVQETFEPGKKAVFDFLRNAWAKLNPTRISSWIYPGFSAIEEVNKRKGLLLEVGGPTGRGYTIVNTNQFTEKILVSNVAPGCPIYNNDGELIGYEGNVDIMVDAIRLPFRDGTVGALLGACLPYIIRNQVINEAARVLEKGGILIWEGGRQEDIIEAEKVGLILMQYTKEFDAYTSSYDYWGLIFQK